MKCRTCKNGPVGPGTATVTLERGPSIVIIKEVPANVCSQCGDYSLNETVSARVLALAEDAASRNAEIEVIRYAA